MNPSSRTSGVPLLVGITTTVPVEVVFAAGARPLDLNNVFIAADDPLELVDAAEADGMPRNTCAWIKGLFTVARRRRVDAVIGCVNGDCSNTQALMENFQLEGLRVIPFAYPHARDADALDRSLNELCDAFGVARDAAERQKERLDAARRAALRIDELTWKENRVTGRENHLWLVSCSDFGGDPEAFLADADAFLRDARTRPPLPPGPRIGYVGVPPICPDLYDFLEELGARVVFNEIQRQFAMPAASRNLVEQYLAYTYPYDVFGRIDDIAREARRRRLDGVIHYVQSFCYRQIQDRILRRRLGLPILTLEFDRPGPLDGQARIRLEAFVEMLQDRA